MDSLLLFKKLIMTMKIKGYKLCYPKAFSLMFMALDSSKASAMFLIEFFL